MYICLYMYMYMYIYICVYVPVAILAQVTHFLFTRGEGLGPGGKCVQPFCLEPVQRGSPDAMW